MATYWVSNSGNDSNNGSRGSPWLTLQHAVNTWVAGDTVRVLPGTYTNTGSAAIINNVSGTANARLTLISDTLHAAKITTTGPTVCVDNRGNYVTIDGFEVTTTNAPACYGILMRATYGIVSRNIVHDIAQNSVPANGAGGVSSTSLSGVFSGHHNDFIGNICYNIGPLSANNLDHGVYLALPYDRALNNISYNNASRGIQLYHAATNNVVANNLVFGNRSVCGIIISADPALGVPCDNCIISNNIVINNSGNGIQENGSAVGYNNQYLNNCIYGNSVSPQISVQHNNLISGTITADAQFVNYQSDGTGNYHLLVTSPCIGAGTSVGAPLSDYDGNPRPQGLGFDIGPYQYLLVRQDGLLGGVNSGIGGIVVSSAVDGIA